MMTSMRRKILSLMFFSSSHQQQVILCQLQQTTARHYKTANDMNNIGTFTSNNLLVVMFADFLRGKTYKNMDLECVFTKIMNN